MLRGGWDDGRTSMNGGSTLLTHLGFLVAGGAVVWSVEPSPPAERLGSVQGLLMLALAYLCGIGTYGLTFYYLQDWMSRRARGFFIHQDAELYQRVARKLRGQGLGWPDEEETDYPTALPLEKQWVFDYCTLYVAQHGAKQLWTHLVYSWDILRLCVAAFAALAIGACFQIRRSMTELASPGVYGPMMLLLAVLVLYMLWQRHRAYMREVWLAFEICAPEAGNDGVADATE